MKHIFAIFSTLIISISTTVFSQNKKGASENFKYYDEEIKYDNFQFSPDGKWISFIKYDSNYSNIYLLPFGGKLEEATLATQKNKENIVEYHWTNNGKSILYISKNSELYSLSTFNLDTYSLQNSYHTHILNQVMNRPKVIHFSSKKHNIIYLAYTPNLNELEEIYELDVAKGKFNSFNSNLYRFDQAFFDQNDRIKFSVVVEDNKKHIIKLSEENSETVYSTSSIDENIHIDTYNENENILYFTKQKKSTKQLISIDLDENTNDQYNTKIIADGFINTIKDLQLGKILGVNFGIKPPFKLWLQNQIYFDSIQALHPSGKIDIINYTPIQNQIIYSVTDFQYPKTYFIYDISKDSSLLLTSTLPNSYTQVQTLKNSQTNILVSKSQQGQNLYHLLTSHQPSKNKLPLIVEINESNFNLDPERVFRPYDHFFNSQGYQILTPQINTLNSDSLEFDHHIHNILTNIIKSIELAILQNQVDEKNVFLYGEGIGAYIALKTFEKKPELISGVILNNGPINIQTKISSYPENWVKKKLDFLYQMGIHQYDISKITNNKNSTTIPEKSLILVSNSAVDISQKEIKYLAELSKNQPNTYFLSMSQNEINHFNHRPFMIEILNSWTKKKYQIHPEVKNFIDQHHTKLDENLDEKSIKNFTPDTFPILRNKYRKNQVTYEVTMTWNGEVQKFNQIHQLKVEPSRYLIEVYQNDPLGIKTETFYMNYDNMPIYQQISREQNKRAYTFTDKTTYIQKETETIEIPTPISYFIDGAILDLIVGNLPLKIGYQMNTYLFDQYFENYIPYQIKVIGEDVIQNKKAYVVVFEPLDPSHQTITLWIDQIAKTLIYSRQVIPHLGNFIIEKQLK